MIERRREKKSLWLTSAPCCLRRDAAEHKIQGGCFYVVMILADSREIPRLAYLGNSLICGCSLSRQPYGSGPLLSTGEHGLAVCPCGNPAPLFGLPWMVRYSPVPCGSC